MTDLSLVPIKELMKKIGERTTEYVFACSHVDDDGVDIVETAYSRANLKTVGLCGILNMDVIDEFEMIEDNRDGKLE